MSRSAATGGSEKPPRPVSALSAAAEEMPQNRKSLHPEKSPSGFMTQLKKRERERENSGKVWSGAVSEAVWLAARRRRRKRTDANYRAPLKHCKQQQRGRTWTWSVAALQGHFVGEENLDSESGTGRTSK